MAVTEISVMYMERNPHVEYGHKEAHATIGVKLEEGETDIGLELDSAMQYAQTVVGEAIGKPVKAKTTTSSKGNISENPEDRQDPEETQEKELTPAQKAARTRAANKKAKEEAAAEAAEEPEVEDETAIDDIDDDEGIDIDDTLDNPNDEDFDEITDADLQTAINAKVKQLRAESHPEAVEAVKAAIAAFADGDPNFSAGSMTQHQRRKFIAKLDALEGPEAD